METISARKIKSVYKPYAEGVLLEHKYIKHMPRAKGEVQKFEVLKQLPSFEELDALRNAHYTWTVNSAIEEAKSVIEDLSVELDDAMEAMPENLQSSQKYDSYSEAKDCIDNAIDELENITLATELKDRTFLLIGYAEGSRANRCQFAKICFALLVQLLRMLQARVNLTQHLPNLMKM
jgi:hypothetical protein